MYDPAFLDDPRLARVLPPSLIAWYRTPAGQAFAVEMRRGFGAPATSGFARSSGGVADHGASADPLPGVSRRPARLRQRHPVGSDLRQSAGAERLPGARATRRGRGSAARLLAGATIEAARAFHLDSLYGTVEAGKVANLVLLRANPLETVEAYDAIDLVVVRGKVLDRSVLAAR